MSCDHELADQWAHCSGRNARYIAVNFIASVCTILQLIILIGVTNVWEPEIRMTILYLKQEPEKVLILEP